MHKKISVITLILSLIVLFISCSNKQKEKNSWAPLFNPNNLNGWVDNHIELKSYKDDTWSIKDGILKTTGNPVGVLYSKKSYKNFEIKFDWKHFKYAGNSGLFIWVKKPGKGSLAKGTEVQILDPGYEEFYYKRYGKKDKKNPWFTGHGDVFPVGTKMTPFPPVSKNPKQKYRSFPSENRTKTFGQWNHYYIKAVNGVIWLSVNGKKVSGGYDIKPDFGPLAFESEGSPIEFKNIMIRELP